MRFRVAIGGVSPAVMRARLADARIALNPLAEQLFADPRFTTAPEASSAEVVVVSVEDLGFGDGATFAELAANAASIGLALCPLELAPQLRLQFTGQPEGAAGHPVTRHRAPPGALTVASPPPPDHETAPWGFYLRRIDGVLWLRGYRSWAGHRWSPEDRLAFVQPSAGGPVNPLRARG